MIGRPTIYSEELADRICAELMMPRSLRRICEDEDWSPAFRTVIGWLAQDNHPFRPKYAHARSVQAQINVDEIVQIADTPQIGEVETDKYDKDGEPITEVRRADMLEHRKLRIAARQWTAEKLLPKVYGQRQHIEHSGSIALTDGTDEELMAELMEMLATGRLKLPNGVKIAEVDEPQEDEDDFSDIA